MTRRCWFTVGCGLVHEHGTTRVYGSGLISSRAHAAHALGPAGEHRPTDLEAIAAQPIAADCAQDVLFVVESFDQLFDTVGDIRVRRARGRSLA